MSRNIAGIEYTELPGSGKISIDSSGSITGTRSFLVEWNDALPFIRAITETTWVALGPYLTQQRPLYPWRLSDGTELCCSNAVINGIGKILEDPDTIYSMAKIDSDWVPVGLSSEDDEGGDLGSLNVDYSAEFLTIPKSSYKQKDDGAKIDQPVGLLIPITEITYNLTGLYSIPKMGIRACRGKLNSGPFEGADRGHTLFLGASSKQALTSNGIVKYDLTLKFKEKSYDWNYVLGRDGLWHEVVAASDGTTNPYSYTNLYQVLQVY